LLCLRGEWFVHSGKKMWHWSMTRSDEAIQTRSAMVAEANESCLHIWMGEATLQPHAGTTISSFGWHTWSCKDLWT
jgi:hypothetical protein